VRAREGKTQTFHKILCADTSCQEGLVGISHGGVGQKNASLLASPRSQSLGALTVQD
jgi:hypothetical protein